jgi:hypothetical protein
MSLRRDELQAWLIVQVFWDVECDHCAAKCARGGAEKEVN